MVLGWQHPGRVGRCGGFFIAGVAQLVEHYLAKVDVARSNRVSRSSPPPPSTWGAFVIPAPAGPAPKEHCPYAAKSYTGN
jgi:hypothetical protein